MSPSVAFVVRLAGHACRLLLAFVFLAAGILKAPDPDGFAAEIATYGILSGWAAVALAYVLIPLELALGLALLLNFRPRLSFTVSTVLMVVFIGAIGYALATGQPLEGCGCFGRNAPRTPQQTLVEDLGFLAAGVVGLLALRAAPTDRRAPRRRGWKGAVVAVAAAGWGAFVVAAPHLPIDDMTTAIGPGVSWASLGVALAEADLSEGDHLVVLMALDGPATRDAVEALNDLASAFPLTGLHAGDEEAYNEFFWTQGPAFPIYAIAPSDMRPMHRRLPRLFALVDGTVTATWNRVPEGAAIEAALGGRL